MRIGLTELKDTQEMIDRQGGKIIFECDCCPATFEADSNDFKEAWEAAKEDGWYTRNVGADWLHSCGSPKCKLK